MTQKLKVVVTDYEYYDLRYEERVLQALPDVELVKGQARTEDEVIEIAKDADGIINQYAPISAKVIEQLEKCKVISRYGVGVNTIDIPKATEKGIYVANVPDYCMDEVSDHTLALLMSWARKVVLLNQYVKNGVWDFKKGIPIHRFQTQTVGVLGFGRIPRSLVKKLIAIGFNVLVYDPYVPEDVIHEAQAEPASLEEIFRKADFVSVHIPLTDETKGLINKDLFKLAKKNLVIVNTARGPVINEQDLIEALQAGQIAGAALDVVEIEPIQPDNPLLTMDNVILTPHVAWYSEESEDEMRSKCARNVLEALQGQTPTYLVNKDVLNVLKK
ncbi:D-3-phosphoglycerate dehydrogenase [Caldalkalibacillus uzonensis]|uniref:D-3-phosphoglycerate dehydrogenase n=1 Tax=Caldalkalibacillus uzonensis TaxID=353224 RepID=A0ABU0CPE0_9BACI|nr:C-terminal binding protein [Caldalkalibacillus uzonensis]MDQ0338289.1 D-3-phosphoglycerate dehydrogenase [Caldalkalibacillus uzonensis]